MHDFELVSKFLTGYNQLNLHVAVVCVVVCKHAHTHTRKVKDNDQIFLAVEINLSRKQQVESL